MTVPALDLDGVVRRFGTTLALDGARLSVLPGEIHALLGENGAGKSTLVAIASGRLRPDAGVLRRDGAERRFATAREARRAGIALVPQHDLLVESATVADNLALLDPAAPRFESRAARRRRARDLAARLGLDLGDPDARAGDLAVGLRQRVEIAGALLDDPAILILDEPTAVLSPDETTALFASLRSRARAGRSVVLITHRLAEVFETADRLTLLSRGRTVLEASVSGTNPDAVAARLVGGSESATPRGDPPSAPEERETSRVVFEADGLVPQGAAAPPASFALHAGEMLTLLAIDGNGADRLASAVAGLVPFRGRVRLDGRFFASGPRAFRAAGGAFVPGDRTREGLVPDLSLEENLALPDPPGTLFLDRATMRRSAGARLARFGVRASGPTALARELSGGNQQKALLARELSREARVVVAVHPTRGLDLAASADIRRHLRDAASRGAAVLVVTADPDEARALGAPIRVVYRGALSEPLPADAPVADLGRRMAGVAA